MTHFSGDWFEREFRKALGDLDPLSSVGCCSLSRFGATVKIVLGSSDLPEYHFYDPARVDVLRLLVQARMDDPSAADPIRVFIKREPHKLSKLKEGRLRLISAVSLVDAVCDRIVFGELSRRALASVGKTPIMVGWSPMGGGSRLIATKFGNRPVRPIDMQAWDWTVDEKLIVALREIFKRFFVNCPEEIAAWIDNRWEALFRDAVFKFGDGTSVQQPGWGIMKSGCFLTIWINSVSQLLLHVKVCRDLGLDWEEYPIVILGDDRTIVDFKEFEQYRARTLELGYIMKPTAVEEDHVPFIGFLFRDGVSVPEYRSKHVFAVTHCDPLKASSLLQSYQILYTHEAGFRRWLELLLGEVDPSAVFTDWELREIYDG